ncbi:MAG: hypothetical protein MUF83_04895 [Acidimicrobiales bacterium]|jgi:hypothetical protein|nr:hypothetical protein [Acidimicrobiales bacterium]
MPRTRTVLLGVFAVVVVLTGAACGDDDETTPTTDAGTSAATGTSAPTTGTSVPAGVTVTYDFDEAVSASEADAAAATMAERLDAAGYPGSTAEPTPDDTGLEITVAGVDDEARAEEILDPLTVAAALYFRPVLAVYPPAPDEEVSDYADDLDPTGGSVDPTADTATDATTVEGTGTDDTATDDTAADDTSTTTTAAGTDIATTAPDADDPDATSVLAQVDPTGAVVQRFGVGPQQLTGTAVQSASSTQLQGDWSVKMVMNPGTEGIDGFNAIAQQCYEQAEVCPTGRLAIELDGNVLTAPGVRTGEPSFTPFSASGVFITAPWFTQDLTELLAVLISSGTLPTSLSPA